MTNLYYDEIESPIGTIITAWNGDGVIFTITLPLI